MVYTNVNSSFPSQVVPDAEKSTLDYGFQVGRAIENEWFRGDRGLGAGGRFGNNWQDFHRLKLYARGEQSVAKYKDELSTIAYWNYYIGEKHTVANKDEEIYTEIPWVELVGF